MLDNKGKDHTLRIHRECISCVHMEVCDRELKEAICNLEEELEKSKEITRCMVIGESIEYLKISIDCEYYKLD